MSSSICATGKLGSVSMAMALAAAGMPTEQARANTVSISGTANGSTLTISASSDRFAGAIESLVYRGVQYVDIADHGRQIQSAIQVDNLGECYNPNEAGSLADGTLPTSSSVLNSISSANNVLTTQTRPAFWLAPGQNYGKPCSPFTSATTAQNTSVLSNYTIGRTTRFYGPAAPNLLVIDTSFTVPENRISASVEALTAYLPPAFTSFLTYDRDSRTLIKLTATNAVQQTSTPLIVALPNGSSAMGAMSGGIPSSDPNRPSYYGYIYYPGNNATAKWSCVFNELNLTAGSTYHYTCPIAVGTVDEVIAAMDAYPGQAASQMVPVFRFYKYPQHFMTRSYSEAAGAGWTFETTGFHLFGTGGPGLLPMYRCYNASNSDHFVSTQSNCEGYNQEGALGYAAAAQSGNLVPLYRFYKGNTKDHLITVNYSEGVNGGYAYEGVLGYVAS